MGEASDKWLSPSVAEVGPGMAFNPRWANQYQQDPSLGSARWLGGEVPAAKPDGLRRENLPLDGAF